VKPVVVTCRSGEARSTVPPDALQSTLWKQ
jgi:hypothetical protein